MVNQGKPIRTFVIIMISIVMIVAACGQVDQGTADGKRVVKIGYLPITHAVPLFMEDAIGQEVGFEDFELELVRFGSWPDLMDALNAGRIDGASVLVTLAMRAKEQGIDLQTVALGHRDGNVLVGSPEIEDASMLAGETYAIPHTFSSHNILLYQMMEEAGMSYDDVNVVELAPAEMPAALNEGRISGYVVAEPFGAMSVAMGTGRVLHQSEELWPHSICCALVMRRDFIESEYDVAEAFVHEYIQAGEEAEHNHEHMRDVSAQYMDVDEEVLDLSLEWIAYDDLRLNEEAYDVLARYMVEMELAQNPPTYDEFVNNSFIDEMK